MITVLLALSLVISLGLLITAYIIIRRLLAKIDTYEEWVLDFKTDVVDTLERMRDIDKSVVFSSRLNEKGAFESDDQVGGVFKDLLELIEKLNQRTQ
jgi:hypothetical protein